MSITLKGFQPGETVTLKWYLTSSSTKTLVKSATVGADGTVRITSARAPTDKPASHTIKAIGNQGSTASAKFRLTAS
jgi:hypothetical protein